MVSTRLKQIAITLFGLLGLLFLGGYLLDKILFNSLVSLVGLLASGNDFASTLGGIVSIRFDSVGVALAYALLAQIRAVTALLGELSLLCPLILIPVAAWLKNQRWAGIFAFLGFMGAALGMGSIALGQGWTFLCSVFEATEYAWYVGETGGSCLLFGFTDMLFWAVIYLGASAAFCLLAVSSLFGYRPAWLFPVSAAMLLPSVGILTTTLSKNALIVALINNFVSGFGIQAVLTVNQYTHLLKTQLLPFVGLCVCLALAVGLLPSLQAAPLIGRKRRGSRSDPSEV